MNTSTPRLFIAATRQNEGKTTVSLGLASALQKRYPRAVVGKFNGRSEDITELDALVAYLQMMGTLVNFTDLPPERLRQ